jgi:hypothetical protein
MAGCAQGMKMDAMIPEDALDIIISCIIDRTRSHPDIARGASSRASLAIKNKEYFTCLSETAWHAGLFFPAKSRAGRPSPSHQHEPRVKKTSKRDYR